MPTSTSMPPDSEDDILRMPAVRKRTGLGRSTIYRMVAAGEFPQPIRLAKRAIGWRRLVINQWSDARPTAAH